MSGTRVDFYVLQATAATARLFFACRLAEKAYGLGSEVYAHTGDDATAGELDQMLWTFRQGSFVPHEVLSVTPPRAPVRIGTARHVLESGDLLINLAGEVPGFAEQFARIAEIVAADPAARAASRERFRHYRDLGFEPVTHNI